MARQLLTYGLMCQAAINTVPIKEGVNGHQLDLRSMLINMHCGVPRMRGNKLIGSSEIINYHTDIVD